MNSHETTLWLTEAARIRLLALLEAAATMPDGARVVQQLPVDPWGDLKEFRRTVYDPLHGLAAPSGPPDASATRLTLSPPETAELKTVIRDLSDAFAGGTPWVALNDSERGAVAAVLARLREEPPS